MEAKTGDGVVEKLTEGSENGTKDENNELFSDASSHVNKTPYFETDSIIIDTDVEMKNIPEAGGGGPSGCIVDTATLPRDNDALLSSVTARATVIVHNPIVARSGWSWD